MAPTDDRPPSAQPIPSDAEVVYRGDIFDVLRWRQVLFDGSTAMFEKVRRRDTALVLPVVDGALRITRQEQPGYPQPFYALVGGRVNLGENPEDAARRELREEAGLTASSLDLWHATQPFPKVDWAVHLFVARDCAPTGERSLDSGERIAMVDVSLDELLSIARSEEFRDVTVALHLLRFAGEAAQLTKARALLFGMPYGPRNSGR